MHHFQLYMCIYRQFTEKHCLLTWLSGINDNEWTTQPTHILEYCGIRGKKVNFLNDHLGLDLNWDLSHIKQVLYH